MPTGRLIGVPSDGNFDRVGAGPLWRPVFVLPSRELLASSGLSADDFLLEGIIQKLPSDGLIGVWRVSEKTVVVTDATVIKEDDGPVKVGAKVEVEGSLESDGSIKAKEIETED